MYKMFRTSKNVIQSILFYKSLKSKVLENSLLCNVLLQSGHAHNLPLCSKTRRDFFKQNALTTSHTWVLFLVEDIWRLLSKQFSWVILVIGFIQAKPEKKTTIEIRFFFCMGCVPRTRLFMHFSWNPQLTLNCCINLLQISKYMKNFFAYYLLAFKHVLSIIFNDLRVIKESKKIISWVWNFCHCLHYRRITSRVSDRIRCRQVSS